MNILEGIKVVDVTAYAFVPSAGGVLAHWGADVIKVESPHAPDPMRFIGGSPGYDALSWWSRGSLNQSAMDLTKIEWPTMGMVGHGDGMSGLVFAGGICAALLHRERTGEARVVDSSLLGTAVWFNALEVMEVHGAPRRPERHRVPRPPAPANAPPGMISALRSLYQTSDFRFVYLLFLGDDDRDWVDLAQRIGRPELANDPRFADARSRNANSGELTAILEESFAASPLDEWKARLADARGAWTVVQTPQEILEDPQVIANGFMRSVENPKGPLMVPVPPIQFDEEAGDPPRAPEFAEHTDDILAEHGYSAEDIRRYREAGTVA